MKSMYEALSDMCYSSVVEMLDITNTDFSSTIISMCSDSSGMLRISLDARPRLEEHYVMRHKSKP